jgi:hypothetical protein
VEFYKTPRTSLLPPRPLPPLPTGPENNIPARLDVSNITATYEVRSTRPSSFTTMGEPPWPPQREAGRELKERVSWDGGRPLWRSDTPKNRSGPPNPHRELTSEGRPLSAKPRTSNDRPRENQLPPPFHITLIRRDPTHGNQWNVGTITNCTTTSLVAVDRSITVEISTPGYKKFVIDNQPFSLESLSPNAPSSARDGASSFSIPSMAQAPQTPSSLSSGPLKFIRQVTLSHTTHSWHRRRSSSEQNPIPTALPSKSRSSNYTFTSPWNGTCTFITGANGRSLKCRHTIPASGSSSSNGHSHPQSPPSAVPVAEVRFNLSPFGSNQVRPSSLGKDGFLMLQGSSPYSTSERDRLDLSLAREHAGGGLRGKSAKLGKLIIEDEGLKMLDLLVAACMGVWWGVYDQ